MEKRKVYRQAGIGGFRRFLAAAAVLALMAASFTVGALAFSREVPVEQETIELPGMRVNPGAGSTPGPSWKKTRNGEGRCSMWTGPMTDP